MRHVVGYWTHQAVSYPCFPIEPAIIERPVGEADESVINRPAALSSASRTDRASRTANPDELFISSRIKPCDLFMAQSCVEVIGDPRLESVEIDIDEERVAA